MKTIYKYPLKICEQQELMLPVDAVMTHLGIDPATEMPAIWCRVETENPPCQQTFYMMGTGDAMSEDHWNDMFHIGTVIVHDFVWHYYVMK